MNNLMSARRKPLPRLIHLLSTRSTLARRVIRKVQQRRKALHNATYIMQTQGRFVENHHPSMKPH